MLDNHEELVYAVLEPLLGYLFMPEINWSIAAGIYSYTTDHKFGKKPKSLVGCSLFEESPCIVVH